MANSVEYFEFYLNLRKHFNIKSFNYKKDRIENTKNRWDFLSRYDKDIILKFRERYTLIEFKKYLLSNLIIDPKIKLQKLNKIGYNNYRKWISYKQNSMYNLKREIKDIKIENLKDVFDCYTDSKISFDTMVYLYIYMIEYKKIKYKTKVKLEKDYINRINKYILLMKIDIEEIKKVIGE